MKDIRTTELNVASAGQGREGRIRVGVSFSLASTFMVRLIESFTSRHAKVHLEFSEGAAMEHIRAVRTLQLDIAFLAGSPSVRGCESRQLWSEQVYIAMSPDDGLAARESLNWRDLRHRQFVAGKAWPGLEMQSFLTRHLSEPGDYPVIERHEVHRENLMQMVAGGGKLTLVSEATTTTQFPSVVYRPLENETIPFCAVWSSANDNPPLRRFLSLAHKLSIE